MVTAAVDVNQSEQFMEALNKELFSLAAVQKKNEKEKNFLIDRAECCYEGY